MIRKPAWAVALFACFVIGCKDQRVDLPFSTLERAASPRPLASREQGPTGVDLLLRRGQELYSAGEFKLSLACYDHALAIDPQSPRAHLGRAQALIELKRVSEAIDSLDKALVIDDRFGEARHELARVFARQGNFRNAHKQLTTLMDQDRRTFFVCMDRAIANMHLERPREAIADLEAAARIDASRSIAYEPQILLARIYAASLSAQVRDGDLAVAHAETASQIAPAKTAGVLETLAMAYAQRGNFGEAIAWQKKANAIAAESDAEPYRQRLTLYESARPYRAAGSSLAKDFHF